MLPKGVHIFGATWCMPCKAYRATLDDNKVQYSYYDIETRYGQELSSICGVKSVPFTVISNGSDIVFSASGVQEIDVVVGVLK